MSGSVYVRTIWIRTPLEILSARIGSFDPFEPLGRRRPMTLAARLRAKHARQGRYWRYRNRQVMRQISWDRRRYGG